MTRLLGKGVAVGPQNPRAASRCRRSSGTRGRLSASLRPDVVVWKADGTPFPGQCYAEPIAERLRHRGMTVRVMRYARRAPPSDLLKVPCHVLSGGDTPAASTQGWMVSARRALRHVLKRAQNDEATVLGVCLGAQLIATTLAGRPITRSSRAGIEVGISRVRRAGTSETLRVAEFHYEEIDPRELRACGGRVTHYNAHSPVQGYRVGPSIAGYQFHPELGVDQVQRLVRGQREMLARRGARSALAMATLESGVSEGAFDSLIARPIARRLAGVGAPTKH